MHLGKWAFSPATYYILHTWAWQWWVGITLQFDKSWLYLIESMQHDCDSVRYRRPNLHPCFMFTSKSNIQVNARHIKKPVYLEREFSSIRLQWKGWVGKKNLSLGSWKSGDENSVMQPKRKFLSWCCWLNLELYKSQTMNILDNTRKESYKIYEVEVCNQTSRK